jgi:5-methylcytosine-specific restriction endonuclease McrA
MEKCSVNNCNNPCSTKGFCHTHYERIRRNGNLTYKRDVIKVCFIIGCDKKISGVNRSGLCTFHRVRKHNGIHPLRQKGNSGHLNPMWKGGVSEYPNHYEMKKNRLIVLKKANYICQFCGKHANEVHHLDMSKNNHKKENLTACCRKCNSQIRNPKHKNASKFRKLYGKNLQELSITLKKSVKTISNMHNNGKIKRLKFLLGLKCYYEKNEKTS